MMIHGYLELGKLHMENWKGEASFYFFKCPVHGYQVNYKNGYNDELSCIPCIREEFGLKKERTTTQLTTEIKKLTDFV